MTKKALTERCREILYKEGDVTGDDFLFLTSILESHPNRDQKIGCGVKRMWAGKNPTYPNRCFWLERTDGTTTDWSFTQCITPTNSFKAACRNAVHPQIWKFRMDNGMDSTRHADHHPESFDSILERFTDLYGKGKVKQNEDNQYGCFLEDSEYEKKWCDFHEEEAVLRDISAKENLTKKRGCTN